MLFLIALFIYVKGISIPIKSFVIMGYYSRSNFSYIKNLDK